MNIYFLTFIGVVAAGFGITGWFLFRLQKNVAKLFGGGETDGDTQKDVIRRITKTETKLEELEPRVIMLESIADISIQKIGFLRFNPFHNTGGDQSFIIILLDRKDNGVVFSSLYMREGVRTYAKEIVQGKSKHPLSEEEKKILEETTRKS